MDSVIVVGLGNPGTEYEGTRHNIGFAVIDELSERLNVRLSAGRGEYLFAEPKVENKHVVLAKPVTYMNNSGSAVVELIERYGISERDLMVIVDDLAIPLGAIRVRARGSDGGHNGLLSIIYQLNSIEFPRIRCGIRKEEMPPKELIAGFVLSPFEKDELKTVREMIARAADAAIAFCTTGIERTMNGFN